MPEQLRVIHLTLLLMGLILALAGLAQQKGPLKRAHDDAVILEKLSRSETEIKAATIALVRKQAALEPQPKGFEEQIRKRIAERPYIQVAVNGTTLYSIDRTEEFMYTYIESSVPNNFLPLSDSLFAVRSTVGEFRNAWEKSPKIVRNPLLTDARFDKQMKLPDMCGFKTVLTPSATLEAYKLTGPIYYRDPVNGYALVIDLSELQKPAERVRNFCSLEIPVDAGNYIQFDLRQVFREVGNRGDWTLSSFKDNFRDLSEATRYLSSLNLQDLENHLLEESNREGEKVEIVGAKIPFDLVSMFGSVILVACQFYLWCHLVEFTKRLQSGAKDEFTAYIGFYDDQLVVRAFTLLSVSFAPAAALVFTIWKGRENHLAWIAPSVSLVIATLLGWLLVRSFLRLWEVKSGRDAKGWETLTPRSSSVSEDGQPAHPAPAEASPSSDDASSPPR